MSSTGTRLSHCPKGENLKYVNKNQLTITNYTKKNYFFHHRSKSLPLAPNTLKPSISGIISSRNPKAIKNGINFTNANESIKKEKSDITN